MTHPRRRWYEVVGIRARFYQAGEQPCDSEADSDDLCDLHDLWVADSNSALVTPDASWATQLPAALIGLEFMPLAQGAHQEGESLGALRTRLDYSGAEYTFGPYLPELVSMIRRIREREGGDQSWVETVVVMLCHRQGEDLTTITLIGHMDLNRDPLGIHWHRIRNRAEKKSTTEEETL